MVAMGSSKPALKRIQRLIAGAMGPGAVIAVFVVVMLLGIATPVTATVTGGPAGRIVQPTDGDVAMPYRTITEITVCYVDMDGSGHYSVDDSVVLVPRGNCSGTSQSTDIRLVPWGERAAGTRLGTGADQGVTLSELSPEPLFAYHDGNDDNRLTVGETVYLRLHNSEHLRSRVGDVRVTPYAEHPAGSRVLATDEDNNLAVTPLGTARESLLHMDVLNTQGFTHHDSFYLSTDETSEVARQGDVRIFNPDPGLAYGSYLGPGDPEPQDPVRRVDRYVCTIDESDTGIHDPGDPLYLSIHTQCTGGAQPGDIRLTNSTAGPAGSRIQQGDADAGKRYGVLPDARVAYLDEDTDGRLSRGDVVVLRIFEPGENRLHAGDVLITPTNRGAGTVLFDGDPLLEAPTKDLGRFDSILFHKPSRGTTSVNDRDPFYLSPDGVTGRGLEVNDVRLLGAQDLPFGGPAGHETGELQTSLTRTAGAVCSTSSIPGDYLAGDPVYLRMDGACPAQVVTGLVRLVPVDDHEAFTIVRAADSDVGRTLLAPGSTPQLTYYSVGESGWGYSTRLYLSIVSPGETSIQVGDIRLTAAGEDLPAGRAVLGTDSDRLASQVTILGSLQTFTGYVDVDRSESFGSTDLAYITPTLTHDHVTPLIVRLTALGDPFVPPELPIPEDDPEPTDEETETSSPPETDTDGDDNGGEDTDDEETPGPAAVAILVVLVFTAWMRAGRLRPSATPQSGQPREGEQEEPSDPRRR